MSLMSSLRLVCACVCVCLRGCMNSAPSPSKTASFARPYWNAATCYGTAHATTTFHEQYNKRDYRYSYGRCGDFVRQDGLRGLALGYCTKVRFTRFLTTPLAMELTGVDLTKPGQGAAQAARLLNEPRASDSIDLLTFTGLQLCSDWLRKASISHETFGPPGVYV